MRSAVVLPLLAVTAALALSAGARAEQIDLHRLFESRCQSCHGHAGDFARANLQLDRDRVTDSRGRDLARFLSRHQGGLAEDEIPPMLALFRRQLESGAFYQQRCRVCHDSARDFARRKLILRDGGLFGRYSDHEIGGFLVGHGRMTEEEARRMTEALAAILGGAR